MFCIGRAVRFWVRQEIRVVVMGVYLWILGFWGRLRREDWIMLAFWLLCCLHYGCCVTRFTYPRDDMSRKVDM